MKRLIVFLLCCLPALGAQPASLPGQKVVLQSGQIRMEILLDRFRFGFSRSAEQIVSPHLDSGILTDGAPLTAVTAESCAADRCRFSATSASGIPVSISVELLPDDVTLTVVPAKPAAVLIRTAGLSPAYGLGDRAASAHRNNTELTGLADEHFRAGSDFTRLASTFVLFPRQGMGELLLWPKVKTVRFTAQENAQGALQADAPLVVHYFFGSTRQIYSAAARIRRQAGYPTYMPKYEMFGVGWEAFGALGWETNQSTIRENVDHYLSLGYPLQWMVIGSGFWPNHPDNMLATTSFGLWDSVRYPSPRPFLQHFHDEHLRILLGLRIAFITDGPFAAEGQRGHYFLEEAGKPKVFTIGFPHAPCSLLDAQKPEAVDWYFSLVAKWKDFGVDGFKEDLYGYDKYDLRDDKLNPISDRLMTLGYDLIERNGYLSSNGDIQRIDDFNYNQDQDRGPVNTLALAYSGLPLTYPDIVGGTFGESRFNIAETPAMDAYMMRNVQWAALHSSLSMGQPPWYFKNPEVQRVMLKATQMHERLHPYIYSQAVRFVHDGYPWTMVPLPVAFPNEPGVYGRENSAVRGYEWMIGDALLATPLYGNDYATATARDIYLPQGTWIDYETGEHLTGPAVLKKHPIPADKTPLFVGGTGITIELENGKLLARIYPVSKTASTEFWDADGRTRSAIELHVSDWKHISVTDITTGSTVATEPARFATQFTLVPGHAYTVK
ncbi:MAG: glycoside hydrolase family 31 protein [Terracidiphilus sp.]|nr:glycoside hydrolase family 31 protein [Terracidiphilus sp.]